MNEGERFIMENRKQVNWQALGGLFHLDFFKVYVIVDKHFILIQLCPVRIFQPKLT